MAITNAIASVAVRDLETAAAWYERMLGRPADSRPIPELAEWKFQRGGWLQLFQQPQRAGTGSVTLAIQDMVFLIQNTQNRDTAAIQIKLDELIRVSQAHNALMDLEELEEVELEKFRKKYQKLAAASRKKIKAGDLDIDSPDTE